MEFQFEHARRRQQDDDNAALAIILSLGLSGKRFSIRTLRTYLTRADLAGHPQFNSVWAHMRAVGNDRAYMTTMGVDLQTFESLLVPFSEAWSFSTITRSDVNANGFPRPDRRSLDAAGGLGLLLHWITSTMPCYNLQQIFSITPAVCTRDLQHARHCLLSVLRGLRIARITWPSKNAYYNGWTCSHYCSNIITFAPDGTIIHAILNAPGLWHDSNIAQRLYKKLMDDTPAHYQRYRCGTPTGAGPLAVTGKDVALLRCLRGDPEKSRGFEL
ncbi:hypothetical protein PTTG_00610 [Puccinia triticina 1-1 BBBD Race 1]|uniref:DDE Tnp4 domain-containing protein n=1 Tax=Puccinia triticina (isolate 1-1 / race 1 (BBBD)) TaxID=630390 RepID=A0A180GNU1_PUCT1|nr:hypothetical protein PTTG_00610 [Puccinia triticina 1-1 BBBD Race 1]